jgi:hypothetical protein
MMTRRSKHSILVAAWPKLGAIRDEPLRLARSRCYTTAQVAMNVYRPRRPRNLRAAQRFVGQNIDKSRVGLSPVTGNAVHHPCERLGGRDIVRAATGF